MIYIAADHAGFHLKKQLIQYLNIKGYEVEDCGAFELDEKDDFPDFIVPCALRVAQGKPEDVGIVIGGSGQGEAIVANKIKGVRAAIYNGGDPRTIGRLAKEHNNANVLSIGARLVSPDDAKKAITAWIDGEYEGGRHEKRLEKISELEK